MAFDRSGRTIRVMTHTPIPPLTLPSATGQLVANPEQLAKVCEHLRAAGVFAFDTEFIGENTYQPVLCLIQVATGERVELIDPMAIPREAMRPFWELLADERLEKICHAGDQDAEIASQESGLTARNMFDAQIAAGMVGISYPVALWRAVEHFTGVTLEKAHTYSAWNRRPLSREQVAYAIDDVRYLPAVHAAMKKRLAELGHDTWMAAACREMCEAAAAPVDARKLFAKIRGAAGLKPEQLAVLREIAALREQIAFEHDVPARTFLKDEVLYEIAERLPETMAALGRIRGMPPEELESYGDEILVAIQTGLNVPEEKRPRLFVPGEDPAEVKRLAENLWVAAQVICLGQSVTPGLVTSQSEVTALARLVHQGKPIDGHPLMGGWHRECLGEKLTALLRGELTVDVTMREEALRAEFSPGDRRR